MKEPLFIQLKASEKSIIKIIFLSRGVLDFIAVLALIGFGLWALIDEPVLGLLLIIAGLLLFYFVKGYLANIIVKETITVTPDTLKVVVKNLLRIKEHEFRVKDIRRFDFAGNHEYTEHPMNNNIVDFTGLGTGEKELQYFINDGTIEIETPDKKLRFGKNMTSWDTEEIIEEIENYLGKKFGAVKKVNKEELGEDYKLDFSIRPYTPGDLDELTEVFKLNVPKYFAAKELDDFIGYLDSMSQTYLVMTMNGAVIGGVGYEAREEDESGRVNWIFIHPAYAKSGYGKKAVEHCLVVLKSEPLVKKYVVRTSQHAYEFFRKLRYDLTEMEKDYWAPGLHLYLMERGI